MHYRWFIDKDKQTDEFGVPVSRAEYDEALHPQKKLYQRGELLAIVVVMFIMLYEWTTDDNPLLAMCISFLTFEMRPLAREFLGRNGEAASNALTGFSVALFVGAVVWSFM
ncbi:MAG: hypothetical protein IIT82_02345 [Selenomonas sp.]|jgi:hypothetical protein|nr:hypothetical protein [Selenomonas sp.]MBQ1613858.1 hypothetical protein [Selenomonas sp.]MBQ1809018.1 hypothetical protein [Selenomonas sp.]MBQ1920024.1 hypothetical protein [Selenomonas sp.]MBQ2086748.1 hypothetical protein [Selenomonas sp.]